MQPYISIVKNLKRMKKLLIAAICLAAVNMARAQNSPLNGNTGNINGVVKADTSLANLSKPIPNDQLLTLNDAINNRIYNSINSSLHIQPITKANVDHMPVAVLKGQSKMPVVKIGGNSKMPVAGYQVKPLLKKDSMAVKP